MNNTSATQPSTNMNIPVGDDGAATVIPPLASPPPPSTGTEPEPQTFPSTDNKTVDVSGSKFKLNKKTAGALFGILFLVSRHQQ